MKRDSVVKISKFYCYVLSHIWKSENDTWDDYFYFNTLFDKTCNGHYKKQQQVFKVQNCIVCRKPPGPNAPDAFKHIVGVHKFG